MKKSIKELYLMFLIIYLVLLPLNAINLGVVGSVSRILAIFPVCFSVLMLLYKPQININLLEGSQLAFYFFAVLSLVWSVNFELTVTRCFSYIMLMILLISCKVFEFDLCDIKYIKKALVYSSRFTALLLLGIGEHIESRLYFGGVIQEDPNYLCAYFSFGIIASIQKIIRKEGNLILNFIEVLIYICVVFLTGSRGGLLAVVIGAVIYYLISLGKNKDFIKNVIFAVLLSVISYNLALLVLPDDVIMRFNLVSIIEERGTGRLDIWYQVFDLYGKSDMLRLFFGYGVATARYCFDIFGYSIVNVVHNVYIEYLLELGIIGVLLYIINITLYCLYSYKFEDKFAFSVLISMIVLSFSTSIVTFKPFFNIMLYILLYYSYKDKIRNYK